MRLENHCKSRWQNTVLYLDQSTLQVVKIIGREMQWPHRIFLLRAIEGLAVVTSYYLALSSVLPKPVVLAASFGRSLDRCCSQLSWMNPSFFDIRKAPNF